MYANHVRQCLLHNLHDVVSILNVNSCQGSYLPPNIHISIYVAYSICVSELERSNLQTVKYQNENGGNAS